MRKFNMLSVFAAVALAFLASPASALDIKVEAFATGLQSPIDLKEAPDGSGRIFIMNQTGSIVIVDADGLQCCQSRFWT